MKVKIKKVNKNAIVPKYAKIGDAGLDLTATSILEDTQLQMKFGTGLAVEIPEGYVGLIFPRSSICKQNLSLSNAVGVIDSGYRGEISFVFNKEPFLRNSQQLYKVGDRIGQLVILPYPAIELEEVTELSETSRGEEGFGSSGT